MTADASQTILVLNAGSSSVKLGLFDAAGETRLDEADAVWDASGAAATGHRTAVRNVRRDANDHLKKMLKEKQISEDAEKDGLDQVQKLTDQHIARINELSDHKEKEVMTV